MSFPIDIVNSMAQLADDIDSARLGLQAELVALQVTVDLRLAPLKERVTQMQLLVNRFVDSDGIQGRVTASPQEARSTIGANVDVPTSISVNDNQNNLLVYPSTATTNPEPPDRVDAMSEIECECLDCLQQINAGGSAVKQEPNELENVENPVDVDSIKSEAESDHGCFYDSGKTIFTDSDMLTRANGHQDQLASTSESMPSEPRNDAVNDTSICADEDEKPLADNVSMENRECECPVDSGKNLPRQCNKVKDEPTDQDHLEVPQQTGHQSTSESHSQTNPSELQSQLDTSSDQPPQPSVLYESTSQQMTGKQ